MNFVANDVVAGGTVNISNPLHHLPGEFSRVPRPDFLEYADTPKPFVAPNGITWVSQGAYEQAIKLDEAQKRIKELELELADLRFPIQGMSGEITENVMVVWRTDRDKNDRLDFELDTCHFCEKEVATLYVVDDYVDVHVCRECLGKMFDTFDKKVTG